MGIYKKSTANILFNGEIHKVFPVRLEMRQGYLMSPLLFHTVLKILSSVRKRKNSIWFRRSKQKTPIISDLG
jgi:hypothetical protein